MRSLYIPQVNMMHLIRWGVFLVACVFLYQRVFGVQGTSAWTIPSVVVSPGAMAILVLVLLLSALNWGLEAVKWRLLVGQVTAVPLATAIRATLTGTTVGLITPNRTGEFLGRVAHLAPEHRTNAAVIGGLGGIAQFSVTMIAGAFGLVALSALSTDLPWSGRISFVAQWFLLLVIVASAVVLLFRPGVVMAPIQRIWPTGKVLAALRLVRGTTFSTSLKVLILSMLRYAVFLGQFVLLLVAFDTGVAWSNALCCVPVVFLVSTLVPTAVLTELGVRGSVAVAFLAPFATSAALVVLASFVLWFINLALPAIIGAALLLRGQRRSSVE